MSPFCGTTDTPILDFWWHFLWASKPQWVLTYLSLAEVYVLCYMFPEIHLWCGTSQPLGILCTMYHVPWSLPHTCKACKAMMGLKTGSYHATAHSMKSGRRSTEWAILAWLFSQILWWQKSSRIPYSILHLLNLIHTSFKIDILRQMQRMAILCINVASS